MNPCIAVSVEADFESGTWTFEPVENFVVGAGRYVIVPEAEYEALKQELSQYRGAESFREACMEDGA